MKVRSDFVTNSSSASYVIEFQLKSNNGQVASFKIRTSDIGTSCVVSDTRDEFESKRHAKALELSTPSEKDGEIYFSLYGRPLSEITSLEDLIGEVLGLAKGHLYDGDWLRARGFMPNAVETMARSCVKQGITRENLRIIGGKIWVMPFGDSFYEVTEYIDQWGVNVQEDELVHTGRIYWKGRNDPNWKPDWQDTVWWPLDGVAEPTPYESVASGTADRRAVRHIDLSGLKARRPFLVPRSSFDTRAMFKGCSRLQELDLSGLDTSRATDMSEMFSGCGELLTLDLSGLDTSRVTNMSEMFRDCTQLRSLDLSSFDTSQVTSMREMFCGCTRLQSIDLSSFDTSQVTSMSSLFFHCDSLTSLGLSDFDTSQVRYLFGTFLGCRCLHELDLSSFDTSQVTDMGNLFYGCEGLRHLDLSAFDTSQVTNMAGTFNDCRGLQELDLSGLDTSRVKSLMCTFEGCESLTSLDLSGLDTSSLKQMVRTFARCTNLKSIDLSGLDMSQVTDTNEAFKGCDCLQRWSISDTWPVHLAFAIPMPTAENGKWWSERDGRWMSIGDIRSRGPIADTFTSER